MNEREFKEKRLDELLIERKHQTELVQFLRQFAEELDRKGFRPLTPLHEMIAAWEHRASIVASDIEELQLELKQQPD